VTNSSSSIRLLATDIDGTLLNPQFQISEGDLSALRRAHAAGIESRVGDRTPAYGSPCRSRSSLASICG
jgi:hypothetical protein